MGKILEILKNLKPSQLRIIRFLIVGFIITVIHNVLYLSFFRFLGYSSTICNFLAFSISVQLSYWGHRLITFRKKGGVSTGESFFKFVTTALLNLGVSSLVSYILIDSMKFHPYYFIAFNVCVLPFISFTLMKLWVFKSNNK